MSERRRSGGRAPALLERAGVANGEGLVYGWLALSVDGEGLGEWRRTEPFTVVDDAGDAVRVEAADLPATAAAPGLTRRG